VSPDTAAARPILSQPVAARSGSGPVCGLGAGSKMWATTSGRMMPRRSPDGSTSTRAAASLASGRGILEGLLGTVRLANVA